MSYEYYWSACLHVTSQQLCDFVIGSAQISATSALTYGLMAAAFIVVIVVIIVLGVMFSRRTPRKDLESALIPHTDS